MPVTQKITGPRGSEFWASLDFDNGQLLQAIVKEEVCRGSVLAQAQRTTFDDLAQFRRSEPANDIHYVHTHADDMPPNVLNMEVSLPCLRDCLVFLYRGAIVIQGQEAITETGHAYAVKNEEWLGLSKNTTIFVMEQGTMKGICKRQTEEERRLNRVRELELLVREHQARREVMEAKSNKPWNKLLHTLRREPEPEAVQCATQ